MSEHVIKFVENTADYTLRECYKRLGNLQIAENAFIEVYAAWYKTLFCNCKIVWKFQLRYEIVQICKSIDSK